MTTSGVPQRLELVGLVVLATSLFACAPRVVVLETGEEPEGVVEIPFGLTRTMHIMLDVVTESGQKLNLLLDSAADGNMLSPIAARALGIPEKAGRVRPVIGISGSVGTARHVRMEEIRIGPLAYRDMPVAVMPIPHNPRRVGVTVHGVLGSSVLGLHEVEIDFPRRTIRLHPDGTFQAGMSTMNGRLREFPYAAAGGMPIIDLPGPSPEPVAALLDTGCGRTTMNRSSAELFGVDPDRTAVVEMRVIRGVTGKPIQCRTYNFERFTLGDLFEGPVHAEVCDMPLLDRLAQHLRRTRAPMMILCNDLLADRTVVLDAADERLYISAP